MCLCLKRWHFHIALYEKCDTKKKEVVQLKLLLNLLLRLGVELWSQWCKKITTQQTSISASGACSAEADERRYVSYHLWWCCVKQSHSQREVAGMLSGGGGGGGGGDDGSRYSCTANSSRIKRRWHSFHWCWAAKCWWCSDIKDYKNFQVSSLNLTKAVSCGDQWSSAAVICRLAASLQYVMTV